MTSKQNGQPLSANTTPPVAVPSSPVKIVNGTGQLRPSAANVTTRIVSSNVHKLPPNANPASVQVINQVGAGTVVSSTPVTNVGVVRTSQPTRVVISSGQTIQARPVAPATQTTPAAVRVAPQQPLIIPRGTNTISLPPGVSLAPGTILMQNDKGQIVFMSRTPAPANHYMHSSGGPIGMPPLPNPRHAGVATSNSSTTAQHVSIRQLTLPTHSAAVANGGGSSLSVTMSPHRHQSHGMIHEKSSFLTPPQAVTVGSGGAIPIQPNPNQAVVSPAAPGAQLLVRPAAGIVRHPNPQTVNMPRPIIPAAQPTPPTAATDRSVKIKKCKNFLETLIRLSSQQPQHILNNVKKLIHGLLTTVVQPDTFTNRLQRELNSQKQPGLSTFLKESLPELRQAIDRGELTIEGLDIRPIDSSAATSSNAPPSMVHINTASTSNHLIRPPISNLQKTSSAVIRPHAQGKASTVPGAGTTPSRSQTKASSASAGVGGSAPKGKQQLDLKDDDDINDVATMGGVNLSEETKNILAAVPESSGQLRSCRDDVFLSHTPLAQKIRKLALLKGMRDVNNEVITLVSHACEERLRHLSEKLTLTAEHRLDIYRVDKRFESSKDVRSQLKFLEVLDKIEHKKHEESEREVLLRAAKSRSKTEDPEQAKLKMKAKEMKEEEMEKQRHLQANETALAAIGPRKKRKYEDTGDSTGSSHISTAFSTNSNQVFNRPRLKRVNLRDLNFVLEEDRDSSKSRTLFKSYLK